MLGAIEETMFESLIKNSSEYHNAAKWGILPDIKVNELLKIMLEFQVDAYNLDFS